MSGEHALEYSVIKSFFECACCMQVMRVGKMRSTKMNFNFFSPVQQVILSAGLPAFWQLVSC